MSRFLFRFEFESFETVQVKRDLAFCIMDAYKLVQNCKHPLNVSVPGICTGIALEAGC